MLWALTRWGTTNNILLLPIVTLYVLFVVFVSFKYLDLPRDPLTGACFSNYIEIGPTTHHRVVCGEQAESYTSPADVRLFAMKFFAGSTPKGHGFIVSYSIGKDLLLVRF